MHGIVNTSISIPLNAKLTHGRRRASKTRSTEQTDFQISGEDIYRELCHYVQGGRQANPPFEAKWWCCERVASWIQVFKGNSHDEMLCRMPRPSFLWPLFGASRTPLAGKFVLSIIRP